MTEFYRSHRNDVNKALFLMSFMLLLFITVKFLFGYIAPFVLGYMISIFLMPLVNLFAKISVRVFGRDIYLPRGVCTIAALVLFIFILAFLGVKGVSTLAEQGRAYVEYIPEILKQFKDILNSLSDLYLHYTGSAPIELQNFLDNQIAALTVVLTDSVGSGVKQGSMSLVASLPNMLITVILSLVSAFFLTKDRITIRNYFSEIAPGWLYENMRLVRYGLRQAVSGYFKAQVTLGGINACICVVGLMIIGYPYALLVGLGISVIDILPVFGAGGILWPWAAYSMITGNAPRAVGLLIIYAIILITRQVLEPKVLGDNIGVYPLVTLMSMYVGLKAFGGFGFIIGPIFVIIAKAVWQASQKGDTTE